MANLPISEFLKERLKEHDPKFELRPGTAYEKLFFQPVQFIAQPLRDEANDIQTSQSVRKILQTDDPDAFSEEAVDDLVANVFVDRVPGSVSSGIASAYYASPVDREYAAGAAVFVGNNGVNYVNTVPFAISRQQMSAQISEGFYFFDIPVSSETFGKETELEQGGLVSLLNDPEVAFVTNRQKIAGGLSREKNTELINRTKNSIAVRDLVTGKGFSATIFENFPGLIKDLRPIGFGDPEMMRDIVYNTHIGGKIDGYFFAPTIKRGFKNFVGLLIDTTRQSKSQTNVSLSGTLWSSLRNSSIDRAGGLNPIVKQNKSETYPEFICPFDLSNPVNLSSNERIKMTINGVTKEFRLAGISPVATNRNEIVSLINKAFGLEVAKPFGNSFKIRPQTPGKDSEIIITDPDIGTSAFSVVFGTTAPFTAYGDGPIIFQETTHYEINDVDGEIRRVLGTSIIAPQNDGKSVTSNTFSLDSIAAAFSSVSVNDILTIHSGVNAGDYRILSISLDFKILTLEQSFASTITSQSFEIRRSGIRDNEIVDVSYYFNPLSIDIGNLVKLDPNGKTRGIRSGRESMTITDLAFLRIVSIELIDPITQEATGEVLVGKGGYGLGSFGAGPFGIGSNADYRLIINSPHERFSAFEDSYIVLNSGFSGLSVRVNYDYVPEVVMLHDFVRSERERVLDGDILIKHFIPAFVEGTIEYSVDASDTSIPSNEEVAIAVREHINSISSGKPLHFSDLKQVISRMTDPFDNYGTFIKNFTLKARIHNIDGTIVIIEGTDNMILPTLDPFPISTNRPQSARITHWCGSEDLVLVRV